MLVLARKLDEKIHIGKNVVITIVRLQGDTVRIGIEAPRDVYVRRGELPPFEQSRQYAQRGRHAGTQHTPNVRDPRDTGLEAKPECWRAQGNGAAKVSIKKPR